MRFSRLAAATVLLLVCSAAPASAATPFTVGQGDGAHIAVDPDGRGHVVWGIPRHGDTPAKVGYCRIPKGGSACEVRADLDYPATPGVVAEADPTDVTVFAPSAAKIVVISACKFCEDGSNLDHVIYWASTVGGDTFQGRIPLGTTPSPAGIGPNGLWLDFELFFVTPAEGNHAIAFQGTGGDVPDVVGPTFVQSPSIARLPGSYKLVYAASNGAAIQFAVEINPLLDAVSAGNPINWDKQKGLLGAEGANVDPQLSGGLSGVYMTYRHAVPGDERIGLRRFNAVSDAFSLPTTIQGDDPIDNSTESPDSEQDVSGRIHVVWRSIHGGGRLRYTRSEPTGDRFTAPANIAQGEAFLEPDVAAAPDGGGWAVWGSGGDSPIRAVRLEPYAESAAPPPAPVPTPAPKPTAKPKPKKKPSTTRTKSAKVRGATLKLTFPRACIKRGAKFQLRVTWKKVKVKKNLFRTIRRTDFYIGKKRVKVDKRSPFSQRLTMSKRAKKGSRVTVKARAYVKVTRGKSPKKTISTRLTVCK